MDLGPSTLGIQDRFKVMRRGSTPPPKAAPSSAPPISRQNTRATQPEVEALQTLVPQSVSDRGPAPDCTSSNIPHGSNDKHRSSSRRSGNFHESYATAEQRKEKPSPSLGEASRRRKKKKTERHYKERGGTYKNGEESGREAEHSNSSRSKTSPKS